MASTADPAKRPPPARPASPPTDAEENHTEPMDAFWFEPAHTIPPQSLIRRLDSLVTSLAGRPASLRPVNPPRAVLELLPKLSARTEAECAIVATCMRLYPSTICARPARASSRQARGLRCQPPATPPPPRPPSAAVCERALCHAVLKDLSSLDGPTTKKELRNPKGISGGLQVRLALQRFCMGKAASAMQQTEVDCRSCC
jgi:hypothetical protein